MTNELKNHLLTEGKNTLALIVKVVLALQVCQAKAKQHKQVQTALEAIQLKKAVMPVNLVKAQVLETLKPILHVALDVESNRNRNRKHYECIN